MYRIVLGECLYFSHPVEEEKTWYDAKQFCANRGGNLLFDKSEEFHTDLNMEMLDLYEGGNLGESTWVGLTKFIWYWPSGMNDM